MKILVTGGYGFIGSAFIRTVLGNTEHSILNIDKLTYAANREALINYTSFENYSEIIGDICDSNLLSSAFSMFKPDWVIHLAAESHVDNSIDAPQSFIRTNVMGTYHLLEQALTYWETMQESKKHNFRFLHVSTDEVYGDLSLDAELFTERTKYNPSSPYSASKASSDHLVYAWFRTFGLPIIISNSSNNYGPHQHEEKLIPKMITRAIQRKILPIYGSGEQIRDWLFVDDHVSALLTLLEKGKPGESYCIGGCCERTNNNVVKLICSTLDDLNPGNDSHMELIQHIQDRKGHDYRYALNIEKIKKLGWSPKHKFEDIIPKLVSSHLNNQMDLLITKQPRVGTTDK